MPSFASTDGPKQAVPIKNHRYQIPRYPFDGPMNPNAPAGVAGTGMLVPWTRVSTILDTHEDKEGVFKWTKRLVVKGLGAREDLYALAAATRLEDKAGLLKIADQAFDYAKGQAASNLGTALHSFLERWVEGDKDLVIPAQWKGDVAAVMAAFQDANIRLRPDLQEMCVVRPDLKDGDAGGLAGRLDLVVEMLNPETGEWELILADYKTGSDPLLYGSWKIQQQLGLYGTGWAVWDGTHWRPMPKIRRDKILMVHVLPGQASCQIHIGDVDPVALEEDLAAAYRTRRRRKEAKRAWRPLVTVEDGVIVDDTAERAVTIDFDSPESVAADQQAAERRAERAAATVARVAAESNPNTDGDDEGLVFGMKPGTPALVPEEPKAGVQGELTRLAPLAGPGERGCGVCGRKGHRRGSPKCLGENDPHLTKVTDQQESFRRENEGPELPDGVQAHPDGGTIEHADGVHPRHGGMPTPEPARCRCTARAGGWTAPADGEGPWVCGDCGLPSKLGVPLAVRTGEQAAERDQQAYDYAADTISPEFAAALAPNHLREADAIRAERWSADRHEGDPAQVAELASATEEPDPFDEDGSDALTPAQPTWRMRIREAKDKAELRTIRAEAMAADEWTQELTQAGLERIKVLAQQG